MPSPVPRWTRWVRSLVGRRIPADTLVASDDGLPQDTNGSASTINLSGLRRMFPGVTACLLAGPPSGPLRRRLRRLRCLYRRSDCYRLERTSCRMGVTPIEEADSDCTCSPTLLKADRAAYRECFRLAGAGRLVPAISATATRSTAMQHAMRRRDPPQPPQPVCDSIRHGMSHLFGQRCLAPIRPD
jgi:hypothetical protein